MIVYNYENLEDFLKALTRRINNEVGSKIKISGISDTLNKFSKNKIAYLTIYADYNKNKIIEKIELANIIIKFIGNSDSSLNKTKSYISTMGYKAFLVKSSFFGISYIVVKITNINDAQIFDNILKYQTSNSTWICSVDEDTADTNDFEVSDGDKGDITVSASGLTWLIDNGVIGDDELGTSIDTIQLADGSVTEAEFQFINTLSSNAQNQINNKISMIIARTDKTILTSQVAKCQRFKLDNICSSINYAKKIYAH